MISGNSTHTSTHTLTLVAGKTARALAPHNWTSNVICWRSYYYALCAKLDI